MVYTVIFLESFLVTLVLTPVIKRVAINRGVLDYPGKVLKIHANPIPYLGGLAIWIAVMSGLVVGRLIRGNFGSEVAGIFLGGGLITLVGLWDDLKNIRPAWKLAGQLAAGLVLAGLNYKIGYTFRDISTILWVFLCVVGGANAVNLIDGLDGLATGLSALMAAGFLVLFVWQGDSLGIMVSAALLGACLGFIPYNFHPASIFMGDSGSNYIGFLLAVMVLRVSLQSAQLSLIILPGFLMAYPIMDTLAAIIRRIKRRSSVFIGDRAHLYDRLFQKGFSQKEVAYISYGIEFTFILAGLFLYRISAK